MANSDDEQPPPDDEQRPKVTPMVPRQRNRVELAARAIEARRDGSQELGFSAREFVMCGLPLKRSAGAVYERRNGSFALKLIGDPSYGLPFGQDRLIPIWLATAFRAAGQPTDNIIRFRCASDILRAFNLPPAGPELARLRERILRVFGATYVVQDLARGRDGARAKRYQLISEIDLWFHRRENVNQYTLWSNVIRLDAGFADDLRRASVPIDLDSIRALKENPAALDLYVWQAWRSYRLVLGRGQSVEVPVFGEAGLLEQLGSTTVDPRKARQLLRRWQGLVDAVWPECPNELSADASKLVIRPAVAVNLKAKLSLHGVCENPPQPMARALDERSRLHLARPPVEDPVD